MSSLFFEGIIEIKDRMAWACMVKTVVSTHWLKRSTILRCMDCHPSMFSFFIIGYNGVRIIQKEKTLVFIVFDFMPVIYLSLLQPGDFLSGGHTDRQYFSDELSYAGYYDCACCHGGPD